MKHKLTDEQLIVLGQLQKALAIANDTCNEQSYSVLDLIQMYAADDGVVNNFSDSVAVMLDWSKFK